jgi:signal transduction histidine kinase
MAHEVRTPLGIIQSSAQILQRETGLTEVGHEMTEFIISETKRLNGLITTLLECSQSKPPRFLLENLHEIIEYTIDLVANQLNEKTSIVTHFNATPSLLYCDRNQMIQVFLNLIMNASQHTLDGEGRIQLNTFGKMTEKAGYLEIQVCDNGKGISEIDKNRVFEPFFTQRKSGIGLGLTVVQQIILAHHGKIFITDSPSGGACFNIILPLMNIQRKVTNHA